MDKVVFIKNLYANSFPEAKPLLIMWLFSLLKIWGARRMGKASHDETGTSGSQVGEV